ncbi:Hypothetical protein mma_1595 [Janthinobacterium sp. Marseille]|nr:hypothetical protein [Janthinobacterium sp. Marseille]ABR91925.1 Hypothetical protein mma_1595 [Janthinobacterium sp. Marseille]
MKNKTFLLTASLCCGVLAYCNAVQAQTTVLPTNSFTTSSVSSTSARSVSTASVPGSYSSHNAYASSANNTSALGSQYIAPDQSMGQVIVGLQSNGSSSMSSYGAGVGSANAAASQLGNASAAQAVSVSPVWPEPYVAPETHGHADVQSNVSIYSSGSTTVTNDGSVQVYSDGNARNNAEATAIPANAWYGNQARAEGSTDGSSNANTNAVAMYGNASFTVNADATQNGNYNASATGVFSGGGGGGNN